MRPEISTVTKLRVFSAAVLSVLLYGAESWPLLAADLRRLEVFQNRCLREIFGIRLSDRVKNTDLRCRAKLPSIEDRLTKGRLQLLGHVARMPPYRLPYAALFSAPPGHWKKKSGGQIKTWRRTVEEELRRIHPRYSLKDALNDTQNRGQWRGLIRDLIAAPKAKTRTIVYRR